MRGCCQCFLFFFSLRITLAPQANRAALDIARAEADFASEASMRDGRKWDASTTELSRALSLHTSESGRQTVGGSRRVAAAEATVAFDQAQSMCTVPLHFPLQFEYVCRMTSFRYQQQHSWPLSRP
jgi:hypothetical protein